MYLCIWIVWRLRPALVDRLGRSLVEPINCLHAVIPSTISAVLLAHELATSVNLAKNIVCSMGTLGEIDEYMIFERIGASIGRVFFWILFGLG